MADTSTEQKQKALAVALGQIEKQFGKGSVMKMGDQPLSQIPSVSTGSLGLDVALGIGGLPYGRI
ncbi:MAG: DNA recombination/repair protein RecA, partial [Gammaproteobacteria bacterium]|nr:DNA recombination/repair protein RecA [Gammaproteobacteria bacterium]